MQFKIQQREVHVSIFPQRESELFAPVESLKAIGDVSALVRTHRRHQVLYLNSAAPHCVCPSWEKGCDGTKCQKHYIHSLATLLGTPLDPLLPSELP